MFLQMNGHMLFQMEILLQKYRANFNQTWHKEYLDEGGSVLNKLRTILKKEISFFSLYLLWYNHIFVQKWTFSQVSDVTHGPLVSTWVIVEVLRNEEEPYIKLILHKTSFWLSVFDQNAYILLSNMFPIQKNSISVNVLVDIFFRFIN